MARLSIDVTRAPREFRKGLSEIVAERRKDFPRRGGFGVTFTKVKRKGSHLAVAVSGTGVEVSYARPGDAFRALGRLLGAPARPKGFTESSPFSTLGIMVDCSRNGVLSLDAAKALMRRMALMGLNMMMLYTEDTYEVPGEPFFGYLRGRYTKAELRELDRYAAALGIELVPCIQTLAHLGQILQWPAYSDMRDTGGCLIAEERRTYELIEKMIAAVSSGVSSERIHVGMDEAHGIGTGRYRDRHGVKPPFDILNDHLKKVRGICRKLGLKPMIWSDMYFRLGSASGSYYDGKTSIPRKIIDRIPKGVDFVYWDYYSHEVKHYDEWIERHRMLGHEPVMAGGIWTWNHFWCALPHSLSATDCCMKSCKRKGLAEVFMTMWGDDGMEVDLWSALPGLQFFADHGYTGSADVDRKALAANLRGSCGIEIDDYVAASSIDLPPAVKNPGTFAGNVSKGLLWQDPLLAVMDPEFGRSPLRKHYAALAKKLAKAAAKKNAGAARLELPARIAKVLALKSELRRDLVAAYRKGGRAKLRAIVKGDLADLRRELKQLWKTHRRVWLSLYKPFGLEVLERRYGGLAARLESLSDRLADYAAGRVDSIPELEAKLEKVYGHLRTVNHGRVATPSGIK